MRVRTRISSIEQLQTILTRHNDDEKQLEDYLVKITKWDKENILYEPIGGGITNINWRILNKDENKEYFIKVPGLGTEIFIDRKASLEANSLAAKIGLGPMVYDYLSEFGVEIYDFLNDHSTCTNSSFESLETTKKVLDGYKRFHSAGKLSVVKSGIDLVEDHFQQLSEFKCDIPEDFDFLKYNFYFGKEKLLKAIENTRDVLTIPENYKIGIASISAFNSSYDFKVTDTMI